MMIVHHQQDHLSLVDTKIFTAQKGYVYAAAPFISFASGV
jgi:hypothetical protein